MAQWAVIVDINSFSGSEPNQTVSINGTVQFFDTTKYPGSGAASLNPTAVYPISVLSDSALFVQSIVNTVVTLAPSVQMNVQQGGPLFFDQVDAAHVLFLPPYLPFPTPPPGVPSGVIAVFPDSSTVPSGWLLCDGQNGTPDLTDVFRPKDHSIYIQKQ